MSRIVPHSDICDLPGWEELWSPGKFEHIQRPLRMQDEERRPSENKEIEATVSVVTSTKVRESSFPPYGQRYRLLALHI